MNIFDLLSIFQWWLIWFLLGLIFLPLTISIFHLFFDRGYVFSKILGIMFLSYTIWLFASLKIVTFTTPNLYILLGMFFAVNLYIASRTKFIRILKENWKIFLFEEILFTAGFFLWAFIRAHEPSIHGLEKYMDFGLINSILRSEYFPPKDLWLTPETINYYYFGHLTAAVITKLSNLDSSVTYNLTLSVLFGLTLSASFSVGANLYNFFDKSSSKVFIAGVLSSILVTLAGNLHTIYAFFQNYTSPENPVPFWQLQPMLNFSGYWYPNATRFIPNTIHEFPLYSFVVADLHGHVFNIPTVLFVIALLIAIFYQKKVYLLIYLLLGLTIAVALMTNVLDGPIYLLLICLVLFLKHKSELKKVIMIGFSVGIFSLPFWVNFKPFSQGIGILCAPKFLVNLNKIGPFLFEADHCQTSPLWMLIILYGFFYIIYFIFILKIINSIHKSDYLILILGLFATIAIIVPEFVYVKDIYPGHFRANTVFKFGYQAFIVLSLATGYMLTRIMTNYKKLSSFNILLIFILFTLVAIYPYFAINSYYNSLKSYKGINGLVYLKDLYPEDYQAIIWLRKEIIGQPVILEAQGDSYTDFARVSANTGLPTVIGWPVHEWLWRGSPDEGNKRGEDVAVLYESSDLNKTLELIKKYHIAYVFIGELERQEYKNLNENKFPNLGKIIFKENQTTIYQLN